ncbi:YesL family protein [Thalassobacillus sp. CUG 92003]|uniref:YesL family protein n=1 Tax=Thalassobacillus sp. CUG 92003 TaxID=2736641 RepID=UPI0015E781F9|nr:DUF624 domain-containing protein [Thalassobacillus sp. CUG 92003]
MEGWEKFNKAAYWMLKIAYINLLWILFTFLGLVVLGIFPSTIAMFTIIRGWFRKEEVPIFHTFWRTFRQEFLKGNTFGLIFILIGFFLFYDYTLLHLNEGSLQYLYPVLIFISMGYVMTLLFFFSVYVHFRLTFFQYIKQSFLVAAASPIETIFIAATIILMYIFVTIIPGIIPLFTGSVLAITTTWLSNRAFTKIASKQLNHYTK